MRATIRGMGVTYELIDAPYPYVFAVYRCRCGASESCYGDQSGATPEGWLRTVAGDDEDVVVCPRCLAHAAEA
jgi:hypothetical protein